MGTKWSFPGVKWHNVDQSLPSSAEVKNGESCTSVLSTCLYGMDSEKFSFLTQINNIIQKKKIHRIVKKFQTVSEEDKIKI
jgi:hypothetical protein